MGIDTAISLALTGLKNNQIETELVSKNIANADVAGYTRKSLVRSDQVADSNMVGIKSVVQRSVNAELAKQMNSSQSASGYLGVKADYLSRVDQLIGTTSTGGNIDDLYNGFIESLQTLSTSPDDLNARIQAVGAAQSLASNLNEVSSEVQQMRTDLEAQIADGITQVNALLKNIETYNSKIVAQQATGQDTTDLEDARDEAVSNLASWMDVRSNTDSSGHMSVFTESGMMLVGAQAAQFTFDQRGTLAATTTWSADPDLRSVGTIATATSGSSSTDLIATGTLRSGKLAAMVEMRDVSLVQLQGQLDDIAAAIASAMSDTTAAGTAATNGSETGFDLDLSNMQAGNSFEVQVTGPTGKTKTYTFVRVDDPTTLPLDNSVTADPNDVVTGIDWSGGWASVAAQVQAALGTDYQVSNSGATLQVLNGPAQTTTVKSASVTSTNSSVQGGGTAFSLFVDGSGDMAYTRSLDGADQRVGFASRITVNSGIVKDPSLLVLSSTTTEQGDGARPLALADALNKAQFTFGAETGLVSASGSIKGTIASFLNTTVSYWGSQAQTATAAQDSQTIIQTNLEARYSETSTVNIDQEMARLIQIQSAYAANARVFTIAKEMIDNLMRA